MSKKIFLKTTALDNFYKQKGKVFYLGRFCISDNLDLNEINRYNSLSSNWNIRKKNIADYIYLKKITKKLSIYLKNRLNKIHKKKENQKYWNIILYPWICYYVNTTFDRWKTISRFNKLKQKKKFFTYRYMLPKNFLIFENLYDWHNKICSDTLNNFLFNEIIKFQKIKNIEIIEKKTNKVLIKKDKNVNYNFFNFFRFFDKILSKIAIYYNKVYFDKFSFKKFIFLKLCLKNLQIPAKNFSTFENIRNKQTLNFTLRNNFNIAKNYGSDFERFLYYNLKIFLPTSYLENYITFIKQHRKIIKKKLFIGMYSIHWNDYFKIYLAECYKIGSRYVHSNHGSGVEGNFDTLHDHFDKISHKIIIQNKNIKKKEIFLGSTLFNKGTKSHFSNKLLINYHEPERYFFRFPISTKNLDGHINLFKSLLDSLPNLQKKILKNVKFRSKHNVGFNSELRFSKVFGKNSIENISLMPYKKSILESKLVLCNVPQTSYTESLFNNVPTIIIVEDLRDKNTQSSFFDNRNKQKILNLMLKNNMAFKNYKTAINFINKNWDKIDKWWFQEKIQNTRNIFLEKFYCTKVNSEKKWTTFLKKSIKF